MNRYLIDPRYPKWDLVAHDPAVKILFGLDPKAKWPKEGMPERRIQGIVCWVEPLGTYANFMRARCICPECGQRFPIGRLKQHSKVHA